MFLKTPANLKTRSKNSKLDETNLSTITNNNEDILAKQRRLKVKLKKFLFKYCWFFFEEEAKVALVLGAKMARMQVQIERRALKKKKSPLYDIVCWI